MNRSTPQAFACPRCQRRFQITVRKDSDSVIEGLLLANWKLSGEELVCPHCAPRRQCAEGQHDFRQGSAPWLAGDAARVPSMCARCGLAIRVPRERKARGAVA